MSIDAIVLLVLGMSTFGGALAITVSMYSASASNFRETVMLWHPDSPGGKVRVQPSFLRWLRIRRRPFATLSEMRRAQRNSPYPLHYFIYSWKRPGEPYNPGNRHCDLPEPHGPHVIGWVGDIHFCEGKPK